MHHCFLPPYLLERLAPRDDATPACRDTLRLDARLRSRREHPVQSVQGPPVAAAEGRRLVHDAQNSEDLPGAVARREDDPPSGDAAVDEAFESAGAVWDLFADVFGRQSFDGNGTTVSVSVHFGDELRQRVLGRDPAGVRRR